MHWRRPKNHLPDRTTQFKGVLPSMSPFLFPAGSKAELKIGFEGQLGGSMVGYYKSSYALDGKTKYYALTQFAVIYASVHWHTKW